MKKKNTLGGIIVIVAAVVFFAVALIVDLLNVPNMPLGWVEIAVSVALALYGLILVFVRIKGYGWGIPAILGIIAVVKYIIDYDNSIFVASIVAVVSIALLIWSNVKKTTKQ